MDLKSKTKYRCVQGLTALLGLTDIYLKNDFVDSCFFIDDLYKDKRNKINLFGVTDCAGMIFYC